MRRLVLAAAALPLLSAPAFAQATSITTGTITDPGQLSTGGLSSGIGSAGSSGTAANPGQLDFGRIGTGGGGAPSAGIATGSSGFPPTDDTYLSPLYGKSFR